MDLKAWSLIFYFLPGELWARAPWNLQIDQQLTVLIRIFKWICPSDSVDGAEAWKQNMTGFSTNDSSKKKMRKGPVHTCTFLGKENETKKFCSCVRGFMLLWTSQKIRAGYSELIFSSVVRIPHKSKFTSSYSTLGSTLRFLIDVSIIGEASHQVASL